MENTKKNRKACNSVKLLYIGQLLSVIGLLGEFNFIHPAIGALGLVGLAGIIVMIIGTSKLFKVNKYFLISFIAILAACYIGFSMGIAQGFLLGEEYEYVSWILDVITSLLASLTSMAFTFGIIRGCSKFATGEALSKFGKHMVFMNGGLKFGAIALNVLAAILYSVSTPAYYALALASVIVSFFAEVWFLIYLYRAYKKAKIQIQCNS